MTQDKKRLVKNSAPNIYRFKDVIENLGMVREFTEGLSDSLIELYEARKEKLGANSKWTKQAYNDAADFQLFIDIIPKVNTYLESLMPIMLSIDSINRILKRLPKKPKQYKFVIEVDEENRNCEAYMIGGDDE